MSEYKKNIPGENTSVENLPTENAAVGNKSVGNAAAEKISAGEHKSKSLADKIAHIVRIVSVPPVLATALILLLAIKRDDIITCASEAVVAFIGLAIFPVLAYPLAAIIPSLRKKGRDGQRNTAFVTCFAGYVLSCLYASLTMHASQYRLLCFTYFFSVIILLILNKIVHIRASGHACSVAGPIVLIAAYLGITWVIIGIVLYALILWASLRTHRHTLSEFVWGSLSSVVSAAISYLIFLY